MPGWQSLPHTQQIKEVKSHYPGHHKGRKNTSGSWFIPVQAARTTWTTCSSWSEDGSSYIRHTMAYDTPKSSLEQNKRILKQPVN